MTRRPPFGFVVAPFMRHPAVAQGRRKHAFLLPPLRGKVGMGGVFAAVFLVCPVFAEVIPTTASTQAIAIPVVSTESVAPSQISESTAAAPASSTYSVSGSTSDAASSDAHRNPDFHSVTPFPQFGRCIDTTILSKQSELIIFRL